MDSEEPGNGNAKKKKGQLCHQYVETKDKTFKPHVFFFMYLPIQGEDDQNFVPTELYILCGEDVYWLIMAVSERVKKKSSQRKEARVQRRRKGMQPRCLSQNLIVSACLPKSFDEVQNVIRYSMSSTGA